MEISELAKLKGRIEIWVISDLTKLANIYVNYLGIFGACLVTERSLSKMTPRLREESVGGIRFN